MSRYDMNITVVATEDPAAKYGIRFRLDDADEKPLKVKNHQDQSVDGVTFEKSKFPGMTVDDDHLIRFTLKQSKGMKLEFAQGQHNAIWVAQGTDKIIPDCPKTKPDKPNCIFYGEESRGKTLTVINKNTSICYFSFSLNFVDTSIPGVSEIIKYDPVGDNKNGGIGGIIDDDDDDGDQGGRRDRK